MPAVSLMTLDRPQALKLIYGVDRDPVVAEVGEGPWQLTPPPLDIPLAWLSDEAADAAPPKLRVFPDGRVAGVVAPAGRCLLDGSGECWIVPRPADGRGSRLCAPNTDDGDYYMAHVGSTMTDHGEVATATLAGPGGHAHPYAGASQARQHYDNSDWQAARGRYVWSDTAGGLVFVGALYPWVSDRQLATIRASACSVDYRWIDDEAQYRLIATCLVNVGGLPSRYASVIDQGMVLTLDRLLQLADELGIARTASVSPEYETAVINAVFGEVVSRYASAGSDTIRGAAESMAAAAPPSATSPGHDSERDPAMHPKTDDSSTAAAPQAPCTDCGGDTTLAVRDGDRAVTAAYQVVDSDTPGVAPVTPVLPAASCLQYGDQVTWDGGVGMFSDALPTPEGGTAYLVFAEVAGQLQMDVPTVVPAADASATGSMYSYVMPEDLPLDTMVLPSPDAPTTAPAETTTDDAAVTAASSDDTAPDDEDDDEDEKAHMAAAAGPRPVGSVGARLAAGRVPDGAHALSPVEARLSAAQREAQQRVDRTDAVLASLAEGQTQMAALLASLSDQVADLSRDRLAREMASV